MEKQDTFARVMKTIKPFAKNPQALSAATLDTKLREDLQVNSARLVDIILDLETEFQIEIGDDDADSVETVGDAVRLIDKKLAA
ncbi:MAG: phosphopantetheine-binding protein [Myxococcota bacterium]